MKEIFKIIMLLLFAVNIKAQQIILDKPVKAGELTLFQEINTNNYYYVCDKPKIATDLTTGKPQFSFLRFNFLEKKAEKESEGGGIVHAVIELSVSKEQIEKAKGELRRVNPNGIIQGQAIFSGGTIALISSFGKAGSELTQQVLGIGKAPILDGSKAAISVQLTKKGAQILWESFKTPTPDMAISFEMELKGFRSPKRAVITANFDQIYEHQNVQLAAVTPVLAAEIKTTFDDLYKSGAIKVEQIGEDEKMEKAIEDAYSKLTRMMFEPSGGGSGVPDLGSLANSTTQTPSMLDRATTMLNRARREANQENQRIREQNRQNRGGNNPMEQPSNPNQPPQQGDPNPTTTQTEPEEDPRTARLLGGRRARIDEVAKHFPPDADYEDIPEVSVPTLAVAFSYELKRVRQRGVFRIDLNKYTSDQLVLRFDENFGKINCADCFRQVTIDDPLNKKRDIKVFLDGYNAQDFDKYINSVSAMLRKKHDNGETSEAEVLINRAKFNAEGNDFSLIYGWKDDNMNKWQNYEYKIHWHFFGGLESESEWVKGSSNVLQLAPPYSKKTIDFEVDSEFVQRENIRKIEAKFYEKNGRQEQVKLIKLSAKPEQLSSQVELIQPTNKIDFDYEINFYTNTGEVINIPRKQSDKTFIFINKK